MPADSAQSSRSRPRLSRREWGVVLVLAAVQFTHVVDFVIVMPLGGQLMRELDINAQQFARVVSAYGLSAAVTGVLAAGLLDRFDRKKSLLFNYAAFTLATLLCGVAPDYEMLLLARVLAGAFGGLTGAGVMAVVGDVFEDARRGTATGVVMSAFAVGSIVGLPAGLTLAGELGWGTPFLALAGLSLVAIALAAWVLPNGIHAHGGRHESPWATLYRLASHPAHLKALGFMGLIVFAAFVMMPFLGPYIEGNLGLAGQLRWVYLVGGVCTLISMNVVGRISDQVGKRPVFTVMAAFTMVMILVATNMPPVGLGLTAAMFALFMVAGSGRMVPAQALILGCVRPKDRGAFMSLNTAVQSAALGLASDIGGRIVVSHPNGHLTGFSTAGLVAFALTGLTLLMVRTIKPVDVGPAAVRLDRGPAAKPEPLAV